jgi:hypothetical protein
LILRVTTDARASAIHQPKRAALHYPLVDEQSRHKLTGDALWSPNDFTGHCMVPATLGQLI